MSARPPRHLQSVVPTTRPGRLWASRGASRRAGRAAFSLVEALVASAIVGLMVVASLNLLGSAARTRAADNNHRTALMLAHQLITEVQQQSYEDESSTPLFGPE